MKKIILILLLVLFLTGNLSACGEASRSEESIPSTSASDLLLTPEPTPAPEFTNTPEPTVFPEPTYPPYTKPTPEPTNPPVPTYPPDTKPTAESSPTPEAPAAVHNTMTMTEDEMAELLATLSEPNSESLQDAYTAYYNTLTKAIEEYGFGDDEYGYSGVVHAELIDFNNDGMPELLFLYVDEALDMDIWTGIKVYGYLDGIVCHYSNSFYPNHESFGIATGIDGLSYLCYREYDSYEVYYIYYSVVRSQWKQVLVLYWVDADWDGGWNQEWGGDYEINYYVNGNSVSEQAYDNALELELGVTNVRIPWDWWERSCEDWFLGIDHDYQNCTKCSG